MNLIAELECCNKEAFNCVANLEAYGHLDAGALRGLKNQLNEIRILTECLKEIPEPTTYAYLAVVTETNPLGAILFDGGMFFGADLSTGRNLTVGSVWLVEGYSLPGVPGGVPVLLKQIELKVPA